MSVLRGWYPLGAAAIVVALLSHLGAQEPTFRSTTDLITLQVSVLDRNRRPVRGLTAGDFVVTDGGEERPVVALSVLEVPSRTPGSAPAWDDAATLDVVTNAPKKGRMIVIYFGMISGVGTADRARRIAANAIDALGPDDMAAIVYLSPLSTPINFTSDHARLLRAIESPTLIVPASGGASGSSLCGLGTLETLKQIARVLEPLRDSPKMVIWVDSSIREVDPRPDGPCAYSIPAVHEMFRALQRAQIPVHAINPAGVVSPREFSADQRRVPPGAAPRGPDYSSLRILAENTGGRVVVGTNKPQDAVPAIFAESEVQYLIGFTPRATPSRDPVQRVRVEVRRDAVTVLAPSGYRHPYQRAATDPPADPAGVAAAAAEVSEHARAIANVRPIPDVVLRAAVSAVPDPADREQSLVATVLGIDLPVAGPAPEATEVEVSAYDTNGERHGFDRQTLTLTPAAGATALHVDVLLRMALRPGTYEIRASTVTSGQVGSLYTHVTVENLARTPLAVSGVFLAASSAPRLVTGSDPGAWLPLVPTTTRDFGQADRVTAGIRLVQPRNLLATPVAVETAIVDAAGRQVARVPATVSSAAFSAARVADYVIDLPIATLSPGEYLVTMTAALGKTTVRRTARIRMR